jgi:acetyltransferase-like isoleucine patch superfamily enzyme
LIHTSLKSTGKSIYRANLICKLYTLFIKKSFKKLGARSYIAPPATIRNAHSIEIGDAVFIREHAWLNVTDTRTDGRASLVIGTGAYIGRFSQINAYNDVVIEDNVLISDRVFISDVDHNYRDSNIPIMFQGITKSKSVRLQEGCWIGIGAVILPGVTVGKNSVVAANSVVTKDVPDKTIFAGIPAKLIRRID